MLCRATSISGYLFLLTLWVGRRIDSRCVLHGILVGVVATLLYVGLTLGRPEPLAYLVEGHSVCGSLRHFPVGRTGKAPCCNRGASIRESGSPVLQGSTAPIALGFRVPHAAWSPLSEHSVVGYWSLLPVDKRCLDVATATAQESI